MEIDKFLYRRYNEVTTDIGVSMIPLTDKENSSIYLSIDDTLQPKFVYKFENRYKLTKTLVMYKKANSI